MDSDALKKLNKDKKLVKKLGKADDFILNAFVFLCATVDRSNIQRVGFIDEM